MNVHETFSDSIYEQQTHLAEHELSSFVGRDEMVRPGTSQTLIYRLLRCGQPYIDEGAAAYENRYRQHRIHRLAATAKELGYQLTSVSA